MKQLSREDILGAPDCPEVKVEVPEWGGSVTVAPLTVAQARRVNRAFAQAEPGDNLDANVVLVVEGLREPKLDAGDVVALASKNAGVIVRLATHILRISNLSDTGRAIASAEGN